MATISLVIGVQTTLCNALSIKKLKKYGMSVVLQIITVKKTKKEVITVKNALKILVAFNVRAQPNV